jgi:hypothetical protein
MNDTEPNNEPSLELPPALARRLKDAYGRPPVIPAELDAQLQGEACEHLRRPQSTASKRLLPFPRWLAAAAALVAAAVVTWAPVGSGRKDGFQQADLNGDGQIDVLDSYQFARRLQHGDKLEPSLDLNGDGVVDAKDLEILTARVVQLGKQKG